MGFNLARGHRGGSLRWPLAITAATLAIAACSPPLPDAKPPVTGDPIVAAEVLGRWLKLVGQGDLRIEIRPVLIDSIVRFLADYLRNEIPDVSDDRPLYVHVSDALDQGAVADVSSGAFVGLKLPDPKQMTPVEQPDGSLLFEGSNLGGFIRQSMLKAHGVDPPIGSHPGHQPEGLDLKGMPVSGTAVKLWLYRTAGSGDTRFRISSVAAVEVPVVGRVDVQVSLDGKAVASSGPEADGLAPGTVAEFD